MIGSKAMKIKSFILVWFWSLYFYLRFGKLYHKVEDTIDYMIMEASYKDELGNTVGYWATGFWEPDGFYKGQKLKDFCFADSTRYHKVNGYWRIRGY